MAAFHAYDIRGVFGVDFNEDDVYRMGFYLPEVLNARKFLIGRDVRVSSPIIHARLIQGLMDAGAEVHDIGLSTTPMVYWGTAKYQFDASVMITASHNPAPYNGLKVSRAGALPVGYDTGLRLLEEKIKQRPDENDRENGSLQTLDIRDAYLRFLSQYKSDFSNLKLSIDCSNGMISLFVKNLLGENHQYLFADPDGRFPNHEPNPLDDKNLVALKANVVQHQSDLGIIFDGDADRVMFVDEQGQFISPDLIIALLGHYFLEEKKLKGPVLHDIRTSKAVGEYLIPMGADVHMWRVGRAFAAIKLREIDGIFGGELAGHYYFRDFYYSDSAMLACLLVLRILSGMKKNGISVSQAINNIKAYENSGEINYKLDRKQEAMDAVRDYFTGNEHPTASYDFDGYRIEFQDWWFNIRPSNTEPYLRCLLEARSQELLKEKTKTMDDIIRKFM